MALRKELTRNDAAAMVVCALLIQFVELLRAGGYWERVQGWLDNQGYVDLASVIRLGGTPLDQHFWGLPALIALIESIFPISGFPTLVVISVITSLGASLLMYRLYGAAVAVMFVILCPQWVRLSTMGGSEPIFLCLLLGAWLLYRHDRALVAVILASLATTIRPIGAIAVCAFAVAMAMRRDWRRLAVSLCAAAAIGALYLALMRVATGDPLISAKMYSSHIWKSNGPFSFPFARLVISSVHRLQNEPWSQMVQPVVCMVLLGFGVFALVKHARESLKEYPAELFFVVAYLIFVAFYNDHDLAGFLPRLAIPVYPFLIFCWRTRLPKNRFVYWPLVVISALIAAADLVGFRTVFGFGLHS